MPDRFQNRASGLSAPATNAFAILPDDSVDLIEVTRAIYCGGGGDISVIMLDGGTVLFKNIAAGSILAVRASRVQATSTTATDLVGMV